MPKHWEYRIAHSPDEGDLNALGAEGWELVSVVYGRWSNDFGRTAPRYERAYFKREIAPLAERVAEADADAGSGEG